MKILFLGGDKRSLEMIRSERRIKDREIDVVGYENPPIPLMVLGVINRKVEDLDISIYDVIILPVNGIGNNYGLTAEFSNRKICLPEAIFTKTKSNVAIFTGIRTPNLNKLLSIGGKTVYALMEDKEVTIENSVPTVEGVIGDLIMNNVGRTINGSNILVFGYGNVGRPLVDKLKYLGANMTVGIIKEEDYKTLNEMGIKAIYTTDKKSMMEAVKTNNRIINTVPSMVLSKEYLDCIRRENFGTYILDIASHPHGIDMEYANEMGLNFNIWMGIPSAVAPLTAGDILVKKIDTIIGSNGK